MKAAALFLFGLIPSLALAQVSEPASASLEGQVVSAATGQPLRKATVQLIPYRQTSIQGGIAISDDAGKFKLENLTPGSYQISVSRTGYVPESAFRFGGRNWIIKINRGQHLSDLAIKLTPQGVIAGYVFDENGDPFRNSNVTLFREPGGAQRQWVQYDHVNSDMEGHFVFTGLAAGRYYVGATGQPQISSFPRPPSREPQENYVLTYYPSSLDSTGAVALDISPGGEFRSAEIRLRKARTFRVAGKILNAPTNLQELAVVLDSHDGKGGSARRFGRIRQGAFEFNNILPGSYVIRSTDPQIYDQKTGERQSLPLFCRFPVTVRDEDVNDVQIEFQPGMQVSGTVKVEGGGPLEAAPSIVFQPTDGYTTSRAIQIGENRGFELSNLAPDQYRLSVSQLSREMYVKSIRGGGQELSHSLLDLTKGEPGWIEVLLSTNAAEVLGTVRDDKGEPIPSAGVALWSRAERPSGYVNTDENGTFRFGNLPPGDYFIAASENGDLGNADVRASVEESATMLTLREGSHEAVDLTLKP